MVSIYSRVSAETTYSRQEDSDQGIDFPNLGNDSPLCQYKRELAFHNPSKRNTISAKRDSGFSSSSSTQNEYDEEDNRPRASFEHETNVKNEIVRSIDDSSEKTSPLEHYTTLESQIKSNNISDICERNGCSEINREEKYKRSKRQRNSETFYRRQEEVAEIYKSSLERLNHQARCGKRSWDFDTELIEVQLAGIMAISAVNEAGQAVPGFAGRRNSFITEPLEAECDDRNWSPGYLKVL